MKAQVAVLDIGSSEINMYIAERGINNTFNIKGHSSCSYSGFINAKFIQVSDFKNSIAECFSGIKDAYRDKIKKIYISVPGEFSSVKVVEVVQSFGKNKKVGEGDVVDLINEAAEVEIDSSYVKQNVSPIYYELDDKRRVLDIESKNYQSSSIKAKLSFVFIKKQFITLLSDIMKGHLVYDIEFISSTLSICKYLFNDHLINSERILLDVGNLSTSVALSKGSGLLALNSFSLGGSYITADLSEGLDIEYEFAEKLKSQIVLSLDVGEDDLYEIKSRGFVKTISAETANKIVEGRVEMIGNIINEIIEKYDNNNQKVYLTGGGISYLKGAKDYLSGIINRNIEIISPPLAQMNLPHYSSILGLINVALYEEEKASYNSLYDIIKKRLKRIKKIFGGKND